MTHGSPEDVPGASPLKEGAPSFPEAFEKWALEDTEESWGLIEENLYKIKPSTTFEWVFTEGLLDTRKEVRDLAVTILNLTETPLSEKDMATLKGFMQDEYDVVRYRTAAALWQRGDHDAIAGYLLRRATTDIPDDHPLKPIKDLAEKTLARKFEPIEK